MRIEYTLLIQISKNFPGETPSEEGTKIKTTLINLTIVFHNTK